MKDEKKLTNKEIKNAELTDEQANAASGSIGEHGWTPYSKKCATPGCKNTMPWDWGDTLCPTCRQAKPLRRR